MGKRESRGQQVKTFQAHIPQPDLTYEKVVEKVYFQAADGMFSIYPQPHILGLVGGDAFGKHSEHGSHWWRADRITGDTLDAVMKVNRDVLLRYVSIVREQKKTKVIVFNFKCNVRSFHHTPRDDMHFAPKPAMALAYVVRWRSGKDLYTYDEDVSTRGMRRSGAEGVEIEWTAEREAFFEAMQNGMISAIDRLIDFEKALKIDATKAIAALSRTPLLPAPKKERTDG